MILRRKFQLGNEGPLFVVIKDFKFSEHLMKPVSDGLQ